MYFPAILKEYDVDFMKPMRISEMLEKGIPVPLDYIDTLPKETPLWCIGHLVRLWTNPTTHTYVWTNIYTPMDSSQLIDWGVHYHLYFFGGPEYKDYDAFYWNDRLYQVASHLMCITEIEYKIIENRLQIEHHFPKGTTLEEVQFAINPVMYYKDQLTGTKKEPNFGDIMMSHLWDKIDPEFRNKFMGYMHDLHKTKYLKDLCKEHKKPKKNLITYIKSIFNRVFKHKEKHQ